MNGLRGAGAADGVLPAFPFPLANGLGKARLEAPLARPSLCKTLRIRTDAGLVTGQVSGAERGGFEERRAIDRCAENIGEELHGEVASGHAAVDPQHSFGLFALRMSLSENRFPLFRDMRAARPVRAHRLQQFAGLV